MKSDICWSSKNLKEPEDVVASGTLDTIIILFILGDNISVDITGVFLLYIL